MSKNLDITLLFDIYGNMLTNKQNEVMDYYYNEDLSLSEISEHLGITRQGVRDNIKRAEKQLNEFEEKLKLGEKFKIISDKITEIDKLIVSLENNFFGERKDEITEIKERIDKVIELL